MIEKEIRQSLALAYRILAKLKMDDLTYTHLSARIPGSKEFFIFPFGMLFEEVTASSLLKVSFSGEILSGSEYQYNKTGYIIHGSIYDNRPDIHAIFHLHTTAGVAISVLEEGLVSLSQFSFHFHNKISYHNYNSLALDYQAQGKELANDLGNNKTLILRNHGTLCCGETLQEALFYSYYLEQACKVQLAAFNTGMKIITPDPAICQKASNDMRNFEVNLGMRDWLAFKRIIDKEDTSYML